jgi:hypothetical protein
MNEEFGRRPDQRELEAAFKAAPIPGFKDVKLFVAGLLGSAILTRLAGQDQTFLLSFDVMEATRGEPLADEPDEPLMNAEEAAPFLQGAVEAGAIDAQEMTLLASIMAGRSLADVMSSNLYLRRRLKADFDNDLEAYLDDLSTRTARFVQKAESVRP